jgi:transposase
MNSAQTDVSDLRQSCSGVIELRLSGGRTRRFKSSVTANVLTQIISAVETA